MSEYKITQINVDGEPREWLNPQTKTKVYYIGVMLDGWDKPVSIGKKAPDALKIGDTVYGEVIETDYLTDKWKHGEAPQSSSSSSTQSENKYQRDVTSIPLDVWRTLVGIQGVPTNKIEFHAFFETVREHAEELLTMIGNVRGVDQATSGSHSGSRGEQASPSLSLPIKSQPELAEPTGLDKARQTANQIKGRAVTANDDYTDEEIEAMNG